MQSFYLYVMVNIIIKEDEHTAQVKFSFEASNHGHTWGRVTKTFSHVISSATHSACVSLVKTFEQGTDNQLTTSYTGN